MSRAIPTGYYVSCSGNSQPSASGGLVPAHAMMVFCERKRCSNGDMIFDCTFCGSRTFGRNDYWKKVGLTREQVRAMFPGSILGDGTMP